MRSIWGADAMNVCQCASIRPGISTRPPPLTTVTFLIALASMGEGETRSIMLPLTSTLEERDSVPLLPSKTRTLRNSVAFSVTCGCCVWPGMQIPRIAVMNAANFIRLPGPEFGDCGREALIYFFRAALAFSSKFSPVAKLLDRRAPCDISQVCLSKHPGSFQP